MRHYVPVRVRLVWRCVPSTSPAPAPVQPPCAERHHRGAHRHGLPPDRHQPELGRPPPARALLVSRASRRCRRGPSPPARVRMRGAPLTHALLRPLALSAAQLLHQPGHLRRAHHHQLVPRRAHALAARARRRSADGRGGRGWMDDHPPHLLGAPQLSSRRRCTPPPRAGTYYASAYFLAKSTAETLFQVRRRRRPVAPRPLPPRASVPHQCLAPLPSSLWLARLASKGGPGSSCSGTLTTHTYASVAPAGLHPRRLLPHRLLARR